MVLEPLIALLKEKLSSEPGQALWIIVPASVVVLLTILAILNNQRFRVGWVFAALFAAYLLVFSIAAQTSLLDWKGSLVGYGKEVPRNFLALNRFGDWHYKFASEVPGDKDLAIVTMKRPGSLNEGRFDIARLIRLAVANEARGIAFDFYFNENADPKALDALLCAEIENTKTKAKNFPVLVAYDYEPGKDTITRTRIADSLEACLPFPAAQGHMIGYAERDGIIRMIPLYFRGDRKLESLSLRIARYLEPDLKEPGSWLLQFIKPADDFPIITYDSLIENPAERAKLQDCFVLVGEESKEDSFTTPYGVKPGVVIHAFAIHSLRREHFIKRTSWWSSFMMIAVSCFVIMYVASRPESSWRAILKLGSHFSLESHYSQYPSAFRNLMLIIVSTVLSLLLVLLSAMAMHLSLTWIDVVYPLLALWLFLLILIVLRMGGYKGTRRLSDRASARKGTKQTSQRRSAKSGA
jgi:CHASE2 domain-containing sensor protein